MANYGVVSGGESTSHTSGNDIKYNVIETGENIYIEGDEYHICKAAMLSTAIHEYKQKTNKEILDDIYKRSSCFVKEGTANIGDFIICKLAVRDKTKRNRTGTISEIISLIQAENGCKVVNGSQQKRDGGEIENLIKQSIVELKFNETTPEHAREYGIIAQKPLYIQNLCVSKNKRLKGIGKKVLEYLENYARKNGNDVIFGYVADQASFSRDSRQSFFCDINMIKNWLHSKGYAINDETNDFHKVMENIKGGLADKCSLADIAQKHKVSLVEILKEYKKGIEVELEHTKNEDIAAEITKDHLFENPKYYTIMKNNKLETGGGIGFRVGDIVTLGNNVLELTRVGKTKADGFTGNRKNYPTGLTLTSMKPANQDQINKFIEEAYKPEYWGTKPQYNKIKLTKDELKIKYEVMELDDLIKLKKDRYKNVDIESPKSDDEKALEQVIAAKFSVIQNRIHEKNKKLRAEKETLGSVSGGAIIEFADIEPKIIQVLEEKGEMTTSDAQGVLEAHIALAKEKYGLGFDAEQIADKILALGEPTSAFKGFEYSYENPFALNKAIEAFLDTNQSAISSEAKQFIRRYTGYGGLGEFGASITGSGLLYEFYTPDLIIKKMWGLAYKYGYKNGSVLEPACGTGEMLKYAPKEVMIQGYEINPYSAMIAEILYPQARITKQYFEQVFIEKNNTIKGKLGGLPKYDLVMMNPPYGAISSKDSRYLPMGEQAYTKANTYAEYFITRGLDLLETGGLMVAIIGAELKNGGNLFLDGTMTKTKQDIAEKSELLDAYRLPSKIFERTGVTSEIIVLKKS